MNETGVGAQGAIPWGNMKLAYDFYLSNGPQLLTDPENAGQFEYEAYNDNNKNKATGGRVGFLPFSNSCLELGLSYENAAKTEDQYSLCIQRERVQEYFGGGLYESPSQQELESLLMRGTKQRSQSSP